ncbi:hypothetical protein PRIPAC_74498 [Pristionchus pacificus]|uniref:Uncharacterized protein n=1 Tax=Pristionchus pacificus TaxID=54126 RepID=A0A2A6D069_PRIPA|nr:hypothetical protein PRIPAC_74498 [Pristionchus pacificus]|eukprot:PDM83805.1 hypothetical protein PRIPAC_30292 [Pristionchus pacificus]
MPYYAPSAYYPLPGAPRGAAPPSLQQQQQLHQQYTAPAPQIEQPGGVYSSGGAYSQPSLRRIPSRADVNTAIENQETPYKSFGQGLNSEKQRGLVTSYNPYGNYGQGSVIQSPIRPQGASQREPSEYACDALNPIYRQQQQQTYSQERNLPTAREQLSSSNVWLGARSLNAPTTIVLDGNNNAAPAPLPARSLARGYGSQQRGYSTGAQAESAYIGIPNDLVYAQTNQQRAYNYPQESRQAYASSSRANQASPSTPSKLNPTVARELFAALSSENVRTAVDRDALIPIQSCPAYSTYNGQKVSGRAFAIPADQKYSEYNFDDLNGLRSVIDR